MGNALDPLPRIFVAKQRSGTRFGDVLVQHFAHCTTRVLISLHTCQICTSFSLAIKLRNKITMNLSLMRTESYFRAMVASVGKVGWGTWILLLASRHGHFHMLNCAAAFTGLLASPPLLTKFWRNFHQSGHCLHPWDYNSYHSL